MLSHMITVDELQKIARARLKDATVLLDSKRYDGAVYLCGYAIELKLKARICRFLRWTEFPSSGREFEDYKSLKTHNLDVLLHLSGVEQTVKLGFLTEWSIVSQWNPESRYQCVGTLAEPDANMMIASTKKLLAHI
jgi:hypothetical protein